MAEFQAPLRSKRSKEAIPVQEEEEVEEPPRKQLFQDIAGDSEAGTSSVPVNPEVNTAIEMLEMELRMPQLDIQEIGKMIAEGMVEKTLDDENLHELTTRLSRSGQMLNNVDIWSLADNLSKGAIDSRYVVIGNAFLWNLLKSTMSSVRDKFEHYNFKMANMTSSLAEASKLDFCSSRVHPGEHIVMGHGIFQTLDILDLYNNVVFRKNADITGKSKQFIKAFLTNITKPKCMIWHYSLRRSGTSHKKTLQNLPEHILEALFHFMLSLVGLGASELEMNYEELNIRSRFYDSLGDSEESREQQFENLKTIKKSLMGKFKNGVTDALNEIREMPYNIALRQLIPPPRGKPLDTHQCVTWRQYEALMKRCHEQPTQENLEAKQDLEFKLGIPFGPLFQEMEDDVEIDVEIDK